MQCAKCKREFADGQEVMVEGKGRYMFDPEGDTVVVTDQTAVFCQDCDKVSHREETASRYGVQLTGDANLAKDLREIDP